MYFRVLGHVDLTGRDGKSVEIPAGKQRRLLAALLLRANTWVDSDFLVEAVWPDKQPRSTAGNVKTYIHHLRGVLSPDGEESRIDSRRGAYRLRVERHECDVTVFEDRVSAATGVAEPAVVVEQLSAALGLWRGGPYEPLEGSAVEAEHERLTALLWHARYTLAEALLAAGRAGDAITLLWPLTAEDPLREKTWEHLLRALCADGRWAEVLVAFDKVRQVLADELGIVPGPELRRLHQEALRADEPHDVRANTATSAVAAPSSGSGAVVAHRPAPTVTRPPRTRPRTRGRPRKQIWLTLAVLVTLAVPVTWVVLDDQPNGEVPALTFLAPAPGEIVSGVIKLRVKVSNWSRIGQVDFHRLTWRCPGEGEGYKEYIAPDRRPTGDGIYEMTFDTRQVPDGCLHFGAVGIDRDDDEVLYPHEGTYVLTVVANGTGPHEVVDVPR